MRTSKKLDVVLNGVRYRSTTLLDNCTVSKGVAYPMGPYSEPERHGVSAERVWLCRATVVVETYSIWNDGTGRCIGTSYHVADQHELEALYRKSQDPDLLHFVRLNAVTEAA